MCKKRKQLFYVFDEHTDTSKKLLNLGMNRCGKDEYIMGDSKYYFVTQHECYSGWEVTFMKSDCFDFSYEELIIIIETSRIYDDIMGCLGLLLKKHIERFTDYLINTPTRRCKKIKKEILFIARNCTYVKNMTNLLEICIR